VTLRRKAVRPRRTAPHPPAPRRKTATRGTSATRRTAAPRVRTAAANIAAGQAASAFIAESRRRLRQEYLPKIRHVTQALSKRDLWWRPNSSSNSIGNLMLHLDGNVRQWIVAGVSGVPDVRDRDAEFLAHEAADASALLAQVGRTLLHADRVLARLRPEDLIAPREIQGYRVTVLQAIYHVVEHFSGHTGQILYVAKLRLDRDLALYAHLDGPKRRARRRTPRPRRSRFF